MKAGFNNMSVSLCACEKNKINIWSLFFDRHPNSKEQTSTPTKPKTENPHKNPIFKAKEKNTQKEEARSTK
jgi:hypothetical protein